MALQDYSEDDDFYSQNFEEKNIASVWIELEDRRHEGNTDTLQDLCAVGYYRLSDQESVTFDHEMRDISALLVDLSYSSSFSSEAISAANAFGVEKARRIVVQYDFRYDPTKVIREVADDPVFLGAFPYSED